MDSDRLERHRHLFAYDAWANREALASLRAAGEAAPRRALRLLAHVVGCERLWLGRLERRRAPAAVWPDLDLAGCGAGVEELAGLWSGYLGRLDPVRLDEPVDYVNSLGEAWSSTADEILTHTVLHSVYHRGQVATEMREAGCEPAYTDYIHAVRQGLVE
jgi:uncharacterized damage-inducible protein DinB